jgi:hypothetical protein
VADAVVRIMSRRGFVVKGYIDDFIIISDTESGCQAALDMLISLIQDLGLHINWDKVSLPAQIMTFFGIEINTMDRTLSLPPKKLDEVRQLLTSWAGKRKCTKKQLQVLIGKLNWCSKVVRGGHTFSRNLINMLTCIQKPFHYVRLTPGAKSDINWWIVGLSKFHGFASFNCDIPEPSYTFATDACLIGGAGHFSSDWFYVSWAVDCPEVKDCNINVLELQSVLLSAKRWCHLWSGRHI